MGERAPGGSRSDPRSTGRWSIGHALATSTHSRRPCAPGWMPSTACPYSAESMQRMSHMCYGRRMTDVASRELRNNTRALLARVEAGESITITVDGRPVATLEPIKQRPTWMSREAFIRDVLPYQADPA